MKNLQDFDFDKSHYERPAQKWVCGRLNQGCPCHVGPDKKGNCRATYKKLYECTPWKDEDRWKCSRPNSLGGACSDGPSPVGVCCREIPPCQPQLSHRAIRSRVVKYTIAFATAVLLIFMFGIYTKDFASPGDLTTPHSAIIAKVTSGISEESDDCTICHTAGKGDALAWVTRAFSHEDNHVSESLKCLSCHRQSNEVKGKEKESLALNIHGINNDRLKASTDKIVNGGKSTSLIDFTNLASSLVVSLSGQEVKDDKGNYHQVACTTCHREHHGRQYNLTALTNQQCQTCHTAKFSSFASGHPVFDNFPYERRTRIMFDHTTHFETYFPNTKMEGQVTNIPEKCNDCHKLDGNNQLMIVKTFEETCMKCHQKDVLKTGEDINVIRFPGFNVEGFYTASKDKRYKPEFSKWPSSDVEDTGEVTSIMRLLLSKDEELSDAEISEKLDLWLNDIFMDAPEEGDKAELKAINTYVNMIERFCNEIVEEDNAKLQARFEKVLGASVANDTINKYFPNLSKILQVAQKTLPSIITGKDGSSFEFSDKEMPTGWYYENYAIKYRPSNHQDPLMKNWLDLTAKHYKEKTSTQYIFETLNRCVKCHSVDKGSDDAALKIQWKPSNPSNKGRFNKFSHKPHLALLDEVGCIQCHTLKSQKFPEVPEGQEEPTEEEKEQLKKELFVKFDYSKKYQEKDPHDFMSNFKFINKDLCSQCHTHNAAGDQCTLCHNYHVGSFEPALNTTIKAIQDKVSFREGIQNIDGLLPQKEFAKK